jgi:hypothetical protein
MNAIMAASLTQNTIYLMGFSFMLGSLFTVLILIILDFMRLARTGGFNKADSHASSSYEDTDRANQ